MEAEALHLKGPTQSDALGFGVDQKLTNVRFLICFEEPR
jgi:hypothetical protein